MKSSSSLRDEFVHGGVPILFINTLREGSPNVGHSVSYTVVYPKNMQGLKGVVHKRFYLVVQAVTINCSRGVSINQFGDDMLGVSK